MAGAERGRYLAGEGGPEARRQVEQDLLVLGLQVGDGVGDVFGEGVVQGHLIGGGVVEEVFHWKSGGFWRGKCEDSSTANEVHKHGKKCGQVQVHNDIPRGIHQLQATTERQAVFASSKLIRLRRVSLVGGGHYAPPLCSPTLASLRWGRHAFV